MMNWVHILWSWIIEPMVLILVIGLLIRTVVMNTKLIDLFTKQMHSSTLRAQTYLQNVDREFEVMNKCAKSVKHVFLSFGHAYKDIASGTKTLDEVAKEAKNNLPDELQNTLSCVLRLTSNLSQISLFFNDQGIHKKEHFDIFSSKKAKTMIDELLLRKETTECPQNNPSSGKSTETETEIVETVLKTEDMTACRARSEGLVES